MPLIFVTEEVSKDDRSRLVKLVFENIESIFVTEEVSKLDKSRLVRLVVR